MAYFCHQGVRLYYQQHGHGPALLLINGFGAQAHHWQAQIKAFQAHYRVITFDNRGVGRSESPKGPYSTEMMAEDCCQLLNHLAISKAHICGYSLGGRIAQMFAILHPERIDKLVLAATGMKNYALTQFVLSTYINLLQHQTVSEHSVRALLPWLYSPAFFNHPRKVKHLCRILSQKTPATVGGLQNQLAALIHHNPGSRLAQIQATTLVLSAAEDLLCPAAYSDELMDCIPHAQRLVMPQGGHACLHEYPDCFNHHVLTFLNPSL